MANKLEIVAFSGKRGTGKTTAALYLQDDYGFNKVSFADKLKEHAESLFPGINKSIKNPKLKETPFFKNGESSRMFLIKLGQFMRYWDEEYWIKAAGLKDAQGRIVIDDLRFKNEAKLIKDLGGKIIRINRYENLNVYGKNLDDGSEVDLDDYKDFDYVIDDCVNITITDLMKQCDHAMKDFGYK